MYKYIGIQDLAANALIELLERKECREVSLTTLTNYGTVVVRLLRENGQKALLILTREGTFDMMKDCSEFFSIEEREGQEFIVLQEDKTAEDLRAHFRAYLSIDSLIAFTREDSLKALGVAA